MSAKIDIWSKGEVVGHLLRLFASGQVKDCCSLRVEKGHLRAFYPNCVEDWAKRIPARNVPLDRTARSAPSSYSWPKCPVDCPKYQQSPNLIATLQEEITIPAPTPSEAEGLWDLMHPRIAEIAEPRFSAAHYADAVEAALKEVNARVKAAVKTRTKQEFDGADLMNRAFSITNPVITLADLGGDSGRDEQKGYMQIFAGAMTGIRNPKAHANVEINALRGLHLLFVASLLMYKLDEALGPA